MHPVQNIRISFTHEYIVWYLNASPRTQYIIIHINACVCCYRKTKMLGRLIYKIMHGNKVEATHSHCPDVVYTETKIKLNFVWFFSSVFNAR